MASIPHTNCKKKKKCIITYGKYSNKVVSNRKFRMMTDQISFIHKYNQNIIFNYDLGLMDRKQNEGEGDGE